MVRRRQARQDPIDAMPVWVMRFIPADWASVAAWREAVREYCATNDMARSDPTTWLQVMSNAHAATRNAGDVR